MTHSHQHLFSKFLKVPRSFRKEQDKRGNFRGFTPFDTQQLLLAQQLSDNYFKISIENAGDQPINAVLAQADKDAQVYDPELVRYALMVWIVHDPEARRRKIKIPPLGSRADHIVTPGLSLQASTGRIPLESGDPLSWWREDPNLCEHHEHWHIVFPAFPVNGKSKDREGENFVFMHRQIYDIERITQGLKIAKPLDNYNEEIEEAYDPNPNLSTNPDDDPTTADIPFAARSVGSGNNTIAMMTQYRNQLIDSINGRGSTPFGTDDKSATLVGNTLETTLHNLGHVMIAYIMTPDDLDSSGVSPGVMIETRTASRDPVFYRWHPPHDFKDAPPVVIRQNDIILSFKDKLLEVDANGNSDGWFEYAKREFGGQNFDSDVSHNTVVTNELETEMRDRDFIWAEDNKSSSKITYLYPREFYYFFRVQNTTNEPIDITLRVFLVPEELKDSRVHWIELDKIRKKLGPNEKAVFSQDCDESVIIRKPAQKTPDQMDRSITPAEAEEASILSGDAKSDEFFCDCGWPFNLLLPRGSKEGLKCKLLVFITDGALDTVQSPTQPKKCGSLSFCGAQWGEPYPDARRMGYPFDKPFKNNSFEDTFAGLSNVAIRDVSIKWVKDFPDVSILL
ncbi:9712_t:CDS:2 [Diversispora eburnea]|uniref:9712_t:CDS:1 n=1 Tax=Diversispora eburnea TaxID=1213867 RepID=A0A9N9FIT3_9GLOM|nr:9712_t:CDS:2 [Diversispora eburnea]